MKENLKVLLFPTMMDESSKKIRRLTDLARIIARLKQEGKKIVHCHGVFDLIHPGHIRHFAWAKRNGDVLVVTITADRFVKKGPGRPIFNESLRSEVLASIETIDYVSIVNDDTALKAIRAIRPDFYVKGPDYKHRKKDINIPIKLPEEQKAVEEVGGKLIFSDDEIVFSSSKLINAYFEVFPPKTRKYLDYLRKKYPADYIIDRLLLLKDIKVLIIGDAIIDQYHYCIPMGKSSKEPVMVHQYVSDESFIGGTLATANHLASIIEDIKLVSLLGKKRSFQRFILRKLKQNIHPVFFYQGKNTIIKRRFIDISTNQKLFQLSFIREDFTLSPKVEKEIIDYLNKEIGKYELIIVNDFGHGFLTDRIVKLICNKANFLALNVQTNSANYGFNLITKYKRGDYICIDDREIRLATHDKYGDLKELSKKIFKKMNCRELMITKGPFGTIYYSKKDGIIESPALSDKIVDRVGAGDALFAITSPCVYKGMNGDLVSFIGNVAGSIKVQVVGNRKQIEFSEMVKFINKLLR